MMDSRPTPGVRLSHGKAVVSIEMEWSRKGIGAWR
jgi:hypothetical protein